MKMNLTAWLIGIAALSHSASADYVTFIGQNDDPLSPVGALVTAANWDGVVVPYGSSTGLVSVTQNVYVGGGWRDLVVRQTGGYINGAAQVDFRGGTTTNITSIYEIEDSRPEYASYTNMYTGRMNFFSVSGGDMTFSLLAGHVEIDVLNLNAKGHAVINFRDGILHSTSLIGGNGTVNMLSGGSGEIVIDSQDAGLNKALYLNFETGNKGSFTWGQKAGGVSAGGLWEWLIGNGQVSIDGVVSTNTADFETFGSELSATIKLPDNSYASWVAGYVLSDSAMTADPDHDGVSNLGEYGLGGNPEDPSDRGHSAIVNIVEDNGTNWMQVTYYERKDKAFVGLSYTPECCDSLMSTNWTTAGVEWVGSGMVDVNFNVVTNRLSTDSEAQQYLRLQIESQE